MSEFFPLSHIFWASFCSFIHIFRFQGECTPHQGLILCLCGAFPAPLLWGDWPVIAPSNRAEHLLIHRIQTHTNPKRRKGFLKQAGQKSSKEELLKQRKGPKRTEECRLKVPTHIWEQDAVGSNPATRTIIRQNLVVLADFFLRHHRTIVSAAFAQSFAPSVQL